MNNYRSKQDIISQYFAEHNVSQSQKKISDLTLKDTLYLSTLLSTFKPFSSHCDIKPENKLSPVSVNELDNITSYLFDRKLISISPYTDLSAFTIKNSEINDINLMKIKWKVNLENVESTVLQLNKLIKNSAWPGKWHYDVKSVWLETSALECVEYLRSLSLARDFDVNVTDELQKKILNVLQYFSVSQCFFLLLSAAQETSDHIVCKLIHLENAGDDFIHNFFRGIKNQSQISTEAYDLPMSPLSHKLHNEFLKIGMAGFTDIPRHL